MKSKIRLLWLAGVLLMATAGLIVGGCGGNNDDTEAPYGSTITFLPSELTISMPQGEVHELIRVLVQDAEGTPLNNIKVTIGSSWAYPFDPALYYFYDTNGNLLSSGFEGVTGDYGTYSFYLRIPSLAVSQLLPPTTVTATEVLGAGILTPGSYSYRLTTLSGAAAETNATQSVLCTVTTSSSACRLNWTPSAGASGYNIYGRSAPEFFITAVSGGATVTYLDTGVISVSTPTFPTTNSTASPFGNGFTGVIDAYSGAAYGSMDLSLN